MNRTLLFASFLITAFLSSFRSSIDDPAEVFLESLNEEQLQKTQLPFSALSRSDWHFLPGNMWPRAGIQLFELNPIQKELIFKLLESYLSKSGYDKTLKIIDLENVLAESSGDKVFRDPEKYFIAFYGEVSDPLWAWSFEGHHISYNFTVSGDKISMAPRFMGANPAEIKTGERKGERTLGLEEDLGFELINKLSPEQKEEAIFKKTSYTEIVTSNASEVGPLSPVGIKMESLNADQQLLLLDLINEYLSVMPAGLASKRMNNLKEEDFEKIRFGWAGDTERGKPHYYRVQGKTFLLEFDNTQNSANHIHTVWRDFAGDFGRDLIREHYHSGHSHE